MPPEDTGYAAEENQQALEAQKTEAQRSSVAGVVGFMAAAAFGGRALRGSLRKAVSAIGGGGGKKVQRVTQKFTQRAREQVAKQTARAAAKHGSNTKAAKKAVQQRIRKTENVFDRVQEAAAYEVQQGKRTGGDPALGRFLKNVGVGGPAKMQKRAQYIKNLRKESDSLTDFVKTAVKDKNARKSAASAASAFGVELMSELPAAYAIDHTAGLTAPPGDRPGLADPIGHLEAAAEWLPRAVAYEAVGRVGLGAGKLGMEAVSKASKGAMKGNRAVAGAMGRMYDTALKAQDEARRVADAASAAYDDNIPVASSKIEGAKRAGRQFYQRMKKMAQEKRRRQSPKRKAKRRVQKKKAEKQASVDSDPKAAERTARALDDDPTLRNVEDVFDEGNPRLAQDIGRVDPSKGDNEKHLKSLFRNTFVSASEKEGPGRLQKIFGAEAATLRDVERQLEMQKRSAQKAGEYRGSLKESVEGTQKRIGRIRAGVEKFKKQALDSATTNKGRDLIKKEINPDRIRVSGFSKIRGKTTRMPTGGMIRGKLGHMVDRSTALMRKVSVGKLFQTHTASTPKSDLIQLQGTTVAGGRGVHFTGKGEPGDLAPGVQEVYTSGYAVAKSPGSLRGDVYAFGGENSGAIQKIAENEVQLPSLGNSKLHSMMMRMAGTRHRSDYDSVEHELASRRADLAKKQKGASRSWRDRLRGYMSKMEIGTGVGGSPISRLKDIVGHTNPRNLFKHDSRLWDLKAGDLEPRGGGKEVADAVNFMRQASKRSTAVYNQPEVFQKAVDGLDFGPDFNLKEFGGAEGILQDDRMALKAAKEVLRHTADEAASPSYAHAQKIVNKVEQTSMDALYNTTGEKQGKVLRRFLFEQGVRGTGHNRSPQQLLGEIDELIQSLEGSRLSSEAVAEARAGLKGLEMHYGLQGKISKPYEQLLKGGGGTLEEARQVIQSPEYREVLESFGATRRRAQTDYNTRGFYEADEFGKATREADFMSFAAKPGNVLQMAAAYGLDTMRDAFSFAGLGWKAPIYKGMDEFNILQEAGAGVWGRRAAALGAASVGYRILDTTMDAGIPDGLPGSEGLGVMGANVVANARVGLAELGDFTGATDAAQYMEGLMPKSTTTLPGALLGGYLGGPMGAIAGAALNRMAHVASRDTPFELLMPDLTKDAEQVRAEYSGEKWVGVRKGRGFLLSSQDFAGGRMMQYRPNWYTRMRADVGSTDVMYGSDLAEAFYKPLPLLDFAPGDLFNPQAMQEKHYWDRPYVSPRIPFQNVPLIGPSIGTALGKAYNAIHPYATNRPMHLQDVVGGFADEAGPQGGRIGPGQIQGKYSGAQVGSVVGGLQALGPITQGEGRAQDMVVMETSGRGILDEQFYRLTEAMGFTGFVGQQAAGGEGLFRNPRFASAGQMVDPGRSIHDLEMGDMMGVGEALRRFYPFERGGDQLGPRNMMPEWMNEELKSGDPYCLLPSTLIEIDGEQIPAEKAYRLVDEGGRHEARTHRGRTRPILAAAKRDVDEDVVRLETNSTPWPLEVTEGHPVLVWGKTSTGIEAPVWKLAGDVREGDELLVPGGTRRDELESSASLTTHKYLPLDAVTVRGLVALYKIEPRTGDRYYMHGLDDEDRHAVRRMFGMPGSKYAQRQKRVLTELRRVLADEGLPATIVGASCATLRPLVQAWGHLEEGTWAIEIRPETIGRADHPDWSGRSRYEPETSDQEACRIAAYRLFQALAQAQTPAALTETDDGWPRLELNGSAAARYMMTHNRLRRQKVFPHRSPGGRTCRAQGEKISYAKATVTAAERFAYKGPVYAFEVLEDRSFVAAGVATHNSQVKMGEYLLPGAGYEATTGGGVTGASGGMPVLDVNDIGANAYGTSLRMLDIAREQSSGGWATEKTKEMLINAGMAVQDEAVFVDEQNRLVGTAMKTRSNNPIVVESVSSSEFQSLGGARAQDAERVNALLGAAGRKTGSIVYVDEESGQIASYKHRFDQRQYNDTLQKLQAGRRMAMKYAEQGYGAPGALYSPVDRMRVLQNAAPFSDAYRREAKKAKAIAGTGMMSRREEEQYRRLERQREKMAIPFEIYDRRFTGNGGGIIDPDPRMTQANFNEHIKSAAEYSMVERAAGAVWETATHLRTPLHTKFFGQYDAEEQYTRRVLLGRDFQNWANPVDDFAKPYMHGLMETDDPLQGAASFATGGLIFGGPAAALAGAAFGAVKGAATGAYESMTGNEYIPGRVEETRRVEQAFDRLRYYRARGLYNATGSENYKREMERTAYGWIESGLSPNGWAKQYRDRDDGTPDRGFGSPYQGQSPGRSLAYSASYDPPPEMLGIFGAAPKSERDFLRAFLQTTDPGQQQDILNMVSPDMQSLLGMAWNYQYGTERRAAGQEMDPMRQMQLPATHPAMGMGANPDHYQIRTMEDLGLDAHDSGLGWKDQQRAMEQAAIKPGSLASQMRKGVSANPGDHSAPEMKAIIKGALAQYGVNARVSVEETGGANEIHVQQST